MKDNLFIKSNNGIVSLLVRIDKVNTNTYKIYNLISNKYIKLYALSNNSCIDTLNITEVQLFIERNRLRAVNKNVCDSMLKVSSIKKQIQNTVIKKCKYIINK